MERETFAVFATTPDASVRAADDGARLEEITPGTSYSNYVLLHGVIQHDLYHAGQIALLKKTMS